MAPPHVKYCLLPFILILVWCSHFVIAFHAPFPVISNKWRHLLSRLQLTTSDFRTGLSIQVDGAPVKIVEFMHVKPGKGAAFVRTKIKNLLTGGVQEKTFRAGESVIPADVEKVDLQYTYQEGDELCFMNMNTFDEVRVSKTKVENWELLNEGSTCPITFWNGQIVDVSLPLQAQWKVTETTQNGGQTLAILENGLSVSVPAFIDVGDTIIVTTEDCKYVSRV